MEYAIHSLCSRIAGELTPCVELVRFDIGDKFYPVLISRTISGNRWRPGEALDLKQWTRMLLCAILTRPGDGSLSNYIVKDQKIFCIDNDLSFVEPAEISRLTKINFFSILFCMMPLNTPLDSEALNEFETLNRASILDGWIEDVIQKEKEFSDIHNKSSKLSSELKKLEFGLRQSPGVGVSETTQYYNMGSFQIRQPRELSR